MFTLYNKETLIIYFIKFKLLINFYIYTNN